jgi:hypothetical protein
MIEAIKRRDFITLLGGAAAACARSAGTGARASYRLGSHEELIGVCAALDH